MSQLTFVTKPSKRAEQSEVALKLALKGKRLSLPLPLVIAVGGDGTMLLAIRKYHMEPVIFVGISAGTLGFLQTVDIEQIPQLASALTEGKYELIHSPLLAAHYCNPVNNNALFDEKLEEIGHAFNDISIERGQPRAAKFHLKIDDSSGTFVGDGVIFASPLGSTAYSLAAGGPIIDTDIQDSFIVTPNNPHISRLYSSLQRPHVLGKNRRVRIEVNKQDADERPVQLAIDGQICSPKIDRPISIGLSKRFVKLLQLPSDNHQNRIDNRRLGHL